mmetsp:Transcript_68500/g.198716  ORF Transcript_68500/g.198716 Transcript_68500/m.198716 type:complete len:265 (+) Transcript_68500:695-1489(+)
MQSSRDLHPAERRRRSHRLRTNRPPGNLRGLHCRSAAAVHSSSLATEAVAVALANRHSPLRERRRRIMFCSCLPTTRAARRRLRLLRLLPLCRRRPPAAAQRAPWCRGRRHHRPPPVRHLFARRVRQVCGHWDQQQALRKCPLGRLDPKACPRLRRHEADRTAIVYLGRATWALRPARRRGIQGRSMVRASTAALAPTPVRLRRSRLLMPAYLHGRRMQVGAALDPCDIRISDILSSAIILEVSVRTEASDGRQERWTMTATTM